MPGLDPPEHTECEAVPRHASPFASRDRRAPSRDRPATASALPCIVAVTAQKRADEPTGLTLQQRVPGVPSSKPSPSPSPLQAVPASSCVVVSHIKADSPFAPLAHDDEQPRNDRDGLRPGDEILAVNGHRVGQDPGRAAAMIRAAPAGPLTLVASRGREGLGGDGAARHTAYHLPRQDDGGPPLGDGGLAFARSGSLVRVAAVARDGPFGSCPGLRPGDAVLAIGGRAVRSVAEARRRLAAPQPPARGDRAGGVVTLLVYSFWDMRKRVLEKELELGGEARSDEGGAERRLPWQLSWSHEQPQPQLQQITREHVLLRLPETGVEFRLEFDEEGTCRCAAALRRDGDAAAESQRVAFERLYWQQVCPAIDALNHHACQHVRGLTSALGIAPPVVAEHRDAASRRLPASAGRTAGAVAGEGESRQAVRGVRGRGLPQHPSAKDAADASRWGGRRRSPLPNRAANGGQATFNDAEEENQGRKNSPRLKRPTGNVQANLKEEQRQHANPARAILKEAEEEEVEEEEEEEELNNSSSFEKRLGKAQIFPTQGGERARRRSSGGTVEEEAEPDDMDVFEEQLGRLQAFSMQGIGEATTNVQNGPPNNHCEERPKQGRGWRSRPGRIPRKPSFVPINLSEQSMMSALSANSSDESSDASTDVSSESGTSTTSSIGSSSSSSSESSGPVQGGRGKQASGQQPRGRAAAEAAGLSNSTELVVFKPKKEDRQKRRGKAANDAGGLANSTELVVFDPGSAREAGRDRAAGTAPGRRGDRCRRRPLPPLRLRMRAEDLRRRYRVLPAVLGRGTFGTVRSCVRRRTREEFAVKSIAKEGNAAKANTKLLENEIALVQRVKHPNVVSVADVYQDRTHIHIVMEKCEGGDLFGKIIEEETQLLEGRACEIVGSLLDAVAYLHDRNIVHRDLKAEHLMLKHDDIVSSPIKLIDFGLAILHHPRDPPMTAFAGSAYTIAPEVIQRSYGKECDLWSVGVITYFLLSRKMPFNGKTDEEIFRKIVSADYAYPQWAETGLSEDAKDFVDRLLVADPKRRLTARQALSHLWIRRHNQSRLVGSLNSHEHLAMVPVMEETAVAARETPPPQQEVHARRRAAPRHGMQHRRESARTSAAAPPGRTKPGRRSPVRTTMPGNERLARMLATEEEAILARREPPQETAEGGGRVDSNRHRRQDNARPAAALAGRLNPTRRSPKPIRPVGRGVTSGRNPRRVQHDPDGRVA